MPEDIPETMFALEETRNIGLNLESSMGKYIIIDGWIRLDSRQTDGYIERQHCVVLHVLELVILQVCAARLRKDF